MTHACSQVKCANVKLFSSRASSATLRVGLGRASGMVLVAGSDACGLGAAASLLLLLSKETGYRFMDKS